MDGSRSRCPEVAMSKTVRRSDTSHHSLPQTYPPNQAKTAMVLVEQPACARNWHRGIGRCPVEVRSSMGSLNAGSVTVSKAMVTPCLRRAGAKTNSSLDSRSSQKNSRRSCGNGSLSSWQTEVHGMISPMGHFPNRPFPQARKRLKSARE